MKPSLILAIFLLTLVLAPSSVFADMANINYGRSSCPPGQRTVSCHYETSLGSKNPYDECEKYDNSSNYKYLDGSGGSLRGDARYCEIKAEIQASDYYVGGMVLLMAIFGTLGLILVKTQNEPRN